MDVIQKGLSGVRYLVGTQLISRVLTFILNVLTTRILAPEIVGVYFTYYYFVHLFIY
jgi:O-antigen/teichoic acid export membrane protein